MEKEQHFDFLGIGQALTAIGNTAVGYYSAKEKAEVDKFLATQSAQEQKRINDALLKAKTEQDKIRILQEIKAKAQFKKYLPYYIVGGVLTIGMIVTLIVIYRKK